MTPAALTKDTISFGPFSLNANERRLVKGDDTVELGSRAFDILVILSSRPNEVVSKNDLLELAWPETTVDESTLRVQIANLRRTLGDGKDGARYITTVSGRGYCFVAPVSRTRNDSAEVAAHIRFAGLPSRLTGIIDREDDLQKLVSRLNETRFVTIVGAGGVGKTTVAIAVGHQLLDAFSGAVLFVDLSMLNDPNLVATTAASMLGLSVQSSDATPNLIAYLRNKRLLLILDTCEHLIEAVALLTSKIFVAAPNVHILATSRETLQVEGEHVYRLEPLACPPEDVALTADVAETFPATRLFVERARASGARLHFGDEEAAVVVAICRKLDGVALAIELAARRVEAYGLQQTASLLDQRLTLLWVGPRSAPPRQKTLQATFDWSFGLLSETERIVLRRLAVFVGHFTLDAGLAVASSASLNEALVFTAIDSLVTKSMIAARPIERTMRYRLLDTTRAYALESGIDDKDLGDATQRHAAYYQAWLEKGEGEWSRRSLGTERASLFAGLNNVRAALEWSFGPKGDVGVGIALAAAAVPAFLSMSLLAECYRWSQRALLILDDTTRGGAHEMHLQACFGIASEHIHGQGEAARAALIRSFTIAEAIGDVPNQAGLLGMLHMFHFRSGNFRVALQYATRCREVAKTIENRAATTLAHSILGRTFHHVGDFGSSRVELEAMLRLWSASPQDATVYLAYDRHYRAVMHLARTLWMLGFPEQAVSRAHQTVADAERMDNPTSLAVVLALGASIFLWTGDLATADRYVGASIAVSESHSLGPLFALGQARRAELAIRRGSNATTAVAGLRTAIAKVHAAHYELLSAELSISLVGGLAAVGQFAEGLALSDETARQIEARGDFAYMPELLRAKAKLLLAMPEPRVGDARACLAQSLELSRQQGGRSWELRAAIDMAALLASQEQEKSARAVLEPVFSQFAEGFETTDLMAARNLLAGLA